MSFASKPNHVFSKGPELKLAVENYNFHFVSSDGLEGLEGPY